MHTTQGSDGGERDVAPPAHDDIETMLAGTRAVVTLMTRSLAPALERVTLQQYRLLMVVTAAGPIRSSDLADRIGIRASTLTRIVDRMVRDGWVRRSVATNRREVLVSATDAGTALVAATLDRRRAELHELLGRMSADDRRVLTAASHALVAATGDDPSALPTQAHRPS